MNPLRPTAPMRRAPAEPNAAGALAVAVVGGRHHITVEIPRTNGVKGEMRLLNRSENRETRAAARSAARTMGNPEVTIEGCRDFLDEVATRTVALAVRQPGNTALALASLEEWEECDDDQIAPLWSAYTDLEEQLSPLDVGCTEAEGAAIVAAAKKKDLVSLRSYGSRKLASFLVTSVAPPAS